MPACTTVSYSVARASNIAASASWPMCGVSWLRSFFLAVSFIGGFLHFGTPRMVSGRVKPPPSTFSRARDYAYESSKDDMRGSTDSYATLESVNGLGFGFPYNRGKSWGRIRLQKTVRSGVSALLTIPQGQFVCAAEGCSVPLKFDEGPIEALWCSGTADGDPTALFVGDPRRFISRLKRAH